MQKLDFPAYEFRFKSSENNIQIFDVIRKKFVVLQPEEWVRQHVVHFLIQEKRYPKSLINVEKQLTLNGIRKRYDIVVFHPNGAIHVLVECKAPSVGISQTVFDQIARYNMQLNADFLMVTNGMDHFYCEMDVLSEKYTFLRALPPYTR